MPTSPVSTSRQPLPQLKSIVWFGEPGRFCLIVRNVPSRGFATTGRLERASDRNDANPHTKLDGTAVARRAARTFQLLGGAMDREGNHSESQSAEYGVGGNGEGGSFLDLERFPLQNFPLASHAESNQTRLREIMGEFELVRATLDDAIHTYRKYALAKGRRAQRLFREVDEWLSADDCSWPFSFVNICEVLDLDANYIRTGLKLWRERAQTAKQSAA
jgi:hypothetical protein